jgi:hypothetical protein
LTLLALLLAGATVCSRNARAQERAVEGYVTAVAMPDEFDVNGEHVTLKPKTTYGVMGGKADGGTHASVDGVRVGAFVHVAGTASAKDKSPKGIVAASVLFRDDWDKKLAGFGVVQRVLTAGAEPVFQADGYRIRVTPSTEVSFAGKLKMLADVGPNTWISYKGKRDDHGVLVAAQARFVAAKGWPRFASRTQMHPVQEPVPAQGALMDADGKMEDLHAKVRYGDSEGVCSWHKLSTDQAMQARVLRIGERLVPAYQRQLGDDDPTKIWFRFYVVDDGSVKSELPCNLGLTLIAAQEVARLANDDQIAAVLASGIAFHMQAGSARFIAENRDLLGAELTSAALLLSTGLVLGTAGGYLVQRHLDAKLEEERGRISLALLGDAGYDPWQAPEAWRRLAPKKLPKDLATLKYPNRSWYQLGILNLQYAGAKDAVAGLR